MCNENLVSDTSNGSINRNNIHSVTFEYVSADELLECQGFSLKMDNKSLSLLTEVDSQPDSRTRSAKVDQCTPTLVFLLCLMITNMPMMRIAPVAQQRETGGMSGL